MIKIYFDLAHFFIKLVEAGSIRYTIIIQNLESIQYTILDIHINFLRTFKNVRKKISFLIVRWNVQVFRKRSFAFAYVHKHSLMFIYIYFCSFVFRIIHIHIYFSSHKKIK